MKLAEHFLNHVETLSLPSPEGLGVFKSRFRIWKTQEKYLDASWERRASELFISHCLFRLIASCYGTKLDLGVFFATLLRMTFLWSLLFLCLHSCVAINIVHLP